MCPQAAFWTLMVTRSPAAAAIFTSRSRPNASILPRIRLEMRGCVTPNSFAASAWVSLSRWMWRVSSDIRTAGKEKGGEKQQDLGLETKDWKDDLLALLVKELKPDAFERLAQQILRESGFVKVEVTGRSGDGGIDGVGVLRLSLLSFQVYFQCKRYKGSVSPSAIRDFRGAMVGRTDKGLFITTGTFTAEAKREATRDGAPAIDLIDGDLLCDLLKNLKLGVTARMVEEVSISPEWFTKI